MKVDLEKLEAAVSLSRTGLWGEIVEREFLMRQSWPDTLTELRASRELVAAVKDREAAGYEIGVVVTAALNKYDEAVK